MTAHSDAIKIGYSDYWDVWLERSGSRLVLERYTPLDYEYMEDYIRDNCDLLGEWQDAVYHWRTEQWYDDWLSDYEYRYEDHFSYNGTTDEYYDEYSSDYEYYTFEISHNTREEMLQNVIDSFNDDFNHWHFEYGWDIRAFNELREHILRMYDEWKEWDKEREERAKPHWQVFSYYK